MRLHVCQCCGLSFSWRMSGTNRDRSNNNDYCRDCFRNGEFIDHRLTIQGMEKKLLNMARHRNKINIEDAEETIKILPDLKRWKMTHVH